MFSPISIYSDGASRGNPGEAGAGIIVEADKTYQLAVYLGTKTNNEAEYLAVLSSLKQLPQLLSIAVKNQPLTGLEVSFFLDSKLVVEQLSGRWQIKDIRMKKLADSCRSQINKLGITTSFQHIPREKNAEADRLANLAIDMATGLLS